MTEISRCPFCGNDKQHMGSNDVGSFWVCCEDGCGCEGPYRPSEAEAIQAWNNRATLTAAPASAAEPVNKIDPRHFEILTEAMAEVKATSDGLSDQPIADIVAGCLAEIEALGREPLTIDT